MMTFSYVDVQCGFAAWILTFALLSQEDKERDRIPKKLFSREPPDCRSELSVCLPEPIGREDPVLLSRRPEHL